MGTTRIDREIAVGLHRLSRFMHLGGARRIPVLMYHSIGSDVRPGHPYYDTNTSVGIFRSHLQFLNDNGYTVIDVSDIRAALDTGRTQKSLAITFDDGFSDFYTFALPLLMEYKFPATVYVVSGIPSSGRGSLHGKDLMTWIEVQEAHRSGVSIGSHTVTHPELQRLKPDEIYYELHESKASIEDKLGTPIKSFAHPFAFPEGNKAYLHYLREVLREIGYDNGVTTAIGTVVPENEILFYPRLPANSFDDLRLLEAKLAGSYDWMHLPQYLVKRGKAMRLRNTGAWA